MGKKKKINENLEQVLDSNLDATGIELALLQIRLRETTTRLNNPLTYFMSIPQNERLFRQNQFTTKKVKG